MESEAHCYCASKLGNMLRVMLIPTVQASRKYVKSEVHYYCVSKVGNMLRVMFIATVLAR